MTVKFPLPRLETNEEKLGAICAIGAAVVALRDPGCTDPAERDMLHQLIGLMSAQLFDRRLTEEVDALTQRVILLERQLATLQMHKGGVAVQ